MLDEQARDRDDPPSEETLSTADVAISMAPQPTQIEADAIVGALAAIWLLAEEQPTVTFARALTPWAAASRRQALRTDLRLASKWGRRSEG